MNFPPALGHIFTKESHECRPVVGQGPMRRSHGLDVESGANLNSLTGESRRAVSGSRKFACEIAAQCLGDLASQGTQLRERRLVRKVDRNVGSEKKFAGSYSAHGGSLWPWRIGDSQAAFPRCWWED